MFLCSQSMRHYGCSREHATGTLRHRDFEVIRKDRLCARKTRPLAVVGLIGYGTYLAGDVVRNR